MKEGWEYKKLGEVCSFSRGLTYSKGDVSTESSKMVLRSNNIDLATHSLTFDDIACLKEEFEIPSDKMLHKNDIFICMSNGSTQHLGKVAFVEDDIGYAFGGFMGAIHPNTSVIVPKYAFYSCLSSEYRIFLASVLNGININNLKWSDLSKFTILVPPISEQERIVSELDLLSSIIEKKKTQFKELNNLAQSIFYDMFGDPVTNEKGWEVKKIGDLGEIITGSTPSTKDSENYATSDYCFFKPSDLPTDSIGYLTESEYHISKKGFSVSRKLPKGAILVSCIGSIGKVGILQLDATSNQQINTIIPNNDVISVFLAFSIFSIKEVMTDKANAPVVPIINKSDFSKFNTILPPLCLQQSFAEKIEGIEKQKELIQQSIKETETLFNSRMDYYFN